jgi:glycosyltransferase involved in cell wall biosynthesis
MHAAAQPSQSPTPRLAPAQAGPLLFVSRVTLPPGERGNARYSLDCAGALADGGFDVRTLVTEGAVRTPDMWDMPPTPEEFELVRRAVEELRPAVLLVNYSYLAGLLDLAPAGCLRGILSHDARHRRYEDFMARGLRFESTPWTAEEERQALHRADFVVAIQAEEAAEFARLDPGVAVLTAPCSFRAAPLPEPQRPDSCVFVGSDADHNLHGMNWFLAEVWPRVLAVRPGALLRVVGSVAVRLRSSLPGVSILGRAEDLDPHYRACAVGIAPILAGSGLKLKLVECLSRGRPAVSTAAGVAGLEDPLACGVIQADGAQTFSDALLRLFADPAHAAELGRAGLALVRSRFGRGACYGPLLDHLAAGVGRKEG